MDRAGNAAEADRFVIASESSPIMSPATFEFWDTTGMRLHSQRSPGRDARLVLSSMTPPGIPCTMMNAHLVDGMAVLLCHRPD